MVVVARSHTHTFTHTYIHTYIHTCIHTYIHTYIQGGRLIDTFSLTLELNN